MGVIDWNPSQEIAMSIDEKPLQAALPRHDLPGSPAGSGRPGGGAFSGTGFIQRFGLDVRVVALAVLVDLMAFSADIVSAGLLYPVELGAAVVLGFITYRVQKAWCGDSHDTALIKALIIGLLTAIPVPITGLLTAPSGLLGLIQLFRRRQP
jgi:hypothetical protein